MKRVRASLAEGRKVSIKPEAPQPVTAWAAVDAFVRGAGQLVEDLNAYVDREAAIQKAMSKPEQIYRSERQAISSAMEQADRELELQKFLAKSPERRASFEENYSRLKAALAERQDGRDPNEELRQLMRESIVPIQEPEPHPKEEINEAIRRKYASVMEERAAYFREIRQKLTTDLARRRMVRDRLLEVDCFSCWAAVAPMTADEAANVRLTTGKLFGRLAP